MGRNTLLSTLALAPPSSVTVGAPGLFLPGGSPHWRCAHTGSEVLKQ